MVHEGEVSQFDSAICQRKYLGIYKGIIAHVVDFDSTIMISIEELNHVFLTVSEELEEALPWKAHGYNSVSDVAEIKVKPTVLVSITVPGNHLFHD